jgi:polyribonucleotide nucleotidyltransferase
MIELDAKQVSDAIIKEAFILAQTKIDEMCDIQSQYLSSFSVTPREVLFNKPAQVTIDFVKNLFDDETRSNLIGNTKVNFNDQYKIFERKCLAAVKDSSVELDSDDFTESKIKMAVFDVIKYVIRDRTLHQDLRVDDRGMNDIRPLFTQVDTAPRVHGSGLFWRGDTQVLSTVTL